MSKIIAVVDLGPGDGGKGGVVHKLSIHHQASYVLKVGGAQGSHGVSTEHRKFNFSQWGCGTFEGVKTHITRSLVVSPEGLLNEADGLRYVGITNPFDLLTIDERAICTTPYHGIVSRLKELARGSNPRGTIGTGVGEAYRYASKYPELTITAADLKQNQISKLINVRDQCYHDLKEIIDTKPFLPEDQQAAEDEISLLRDGKFLTYIANQFIEVGKVANIVDHNYLRQKLFNTDKTAIVESSHGILTDNQYGFWPHVSAIRTLPTFTHKMLREYGYDNNIVTIGVHRAYTIRHGAGPMPTADSSMNDALLPGSCKDTNRYQGKVRVGPLDFVLLRYALEVCAPTIDSLAITWFDQISDRWAICDEYKGITDKFFHCHNRIKICEEQNMIDYQCDLCSALFTIQPVISHIAVNSAIEERYSVCNRILHERLGIPVSLVSFGPTARDKLVRSLA